MMIDVAMTAVVVLLLAGITSVLASSFSRDMRQWVWFALAEYLVCASAQMYYSRVIVKGGDALYYAKGGLVLARALDQSFEWSAREVLAILFQQPSAFDKVVLGAGTNTGSMFAVGGLLLFLLRGSETAAQVLISGLSMFGTISIYHACRQAFPEGSPFRMFVATVLFPSIAFWTSALHKEALCIIGTGVLFAAWRAVNTGKILRALFFAPVGATIILIFRAPALVPLLLGLVGYFVIDRIRRTRGVATTVLGPVYLGLGLGAVALAMVLVSRVSPDLALDKISDAVASKQNAWARSVGGSAIDVDDQVPQSAAAQLLRAPLALVNALFRPQFFDVTSPLVLISALEMTAITWMIFRAVRVQGPRALLTRIQSSPFLLMCTVITVVGCTFVGLATLNFGSLARYRVPFLPFYGSLVGVLTERTITAVADQSSKATSRDTALRRKLGRPRAATPTPT